MNMLDFDARKIEQVWSIPFVDNKPETPISLVHQKNAFLQDVIHDWSVHIIAGEHHLKYYGADTCDEFVWLVLVVKKEK